MSTETEKIKAEMKLLHWHKLANDAALKAALLKTKTMKAKDAKRPVGVENVKAKAGWMQRVIEEEQANLCRSRRTLCWSTRRTSGARRSAWMPK